MGNTVKTKGLPGSTLKIAAAASMLIDHIAASVLDRYLAVLGVQIWLPTNKYSLRLFLQMPYLGLRSLDLVMRLVGRPAFPVYCFLLTEGFLHTRSRGKYALRLGVFALLSELPFDLALHGAPVNWQYQNVYFTLLLGLLAMRCMDRLLSSGRDGEGKVPAVLRAVGALALAAGFAWAGEWIRCDYGWQGVAAVTLIYLLRRFSVPMAFSSACALLTALQTIEFTSFGAVPMICRYNGERGLRRKYVFYVFYPAHLLLLAGICALLGV